MNDPSQPNEPIQKYPSFRDDLTRIINCHNLEQVCNTPDFLIADYLIQCFSAYCDIKGENDVWHDSDA